MSIKATPSKNLLAFVCRHGATNLNVGEAPRFRSWIDASLNAEGHKDAIKISRFLWNVPTEQVFCSPLKRAVDTAETLTLPKRLPLIQDRGLLPWHLGTFSGLVKEENMNALELFIKSPDIAIPNGESLNSFRSRTHEFFEQEFAEAKKKGLIILFTHTSNITSLQHFTDADEDPEKTELVGPGGIVAVYSSGNGYSVKPVLNATKKKI